MSTPAISPKFAPFTITDIVYKYVNNTPIPASILIPKDIKSGKHPLVVRWHGGFLITGQRLYADWYAQFMLDFALKHDAIVVTRDYRLMPEASGLEILQDVRDFFGWLLLPGKLDEHLPEGVEVDLEGILMNGESAGGYLAWQSATLYPERTAAVVAHYPMLDLPAPHYTQKYVKQLFSPPAPQLPARILDDHLASLKGDEVVTSAIPPERLPLCLVTLQQGRTAEIFGAEPELYPLEVLEGLRVTPPPTWILHGVQDSAVPVEETRRYAEELKPRFSEARLHLSLREGEHGFDNHDIVTGEPASLEEEWVREGVDFVEQYWPVRT